ncbi:MAG: SCO family protein [Mariprofundaceae bacterium]
MQGKHSYFPIIVIVISLGLVSFGLYQLNRMPESPYPQIKAEFALKGPDGSLSSSDLRGKVGLIFFGYTQCPDVCPATLVNIGATLKLLDESELKKLRPIFISLDPGRDTPEKAAKYAAFFHPAIIGLSGNMEEVNAAKKSFLIAMEKEKPDSANKYIINHSTYIFLMRPDGKIGELLGHADKPEKIAAAIRRWLSWAKG